MSLIRSLVGALIVCITTSTPIEFDSLKIWLYSSKIVRVTYEPSIKYAAPRYNSSLIVSYDASNISLNYNVTQPNKASEPNIYHITTDDLLIIVNDETKWIGFYDINTNDSILTEPVSSDIKGKTFTNTTDALTGEPIYQITQTWELSDTTSLTSSSDSSSDSTVTEALFGLGEYQNSFLNYRDTTVRCVQFNTQACVPLIISNKNYGILWDNYGVLLWNKPDSQIAPANVKSGNGWTNYTARLNTNDSRAASGGKYGFWVELNDMYSFGVGDQKSGSAVSIVLTATYNGNSYTILEYIGRRNYPSSVEGSIWLPSFDSSDNVTLTLSGDGFKFPDSTTNIIYPKLYVRYPSKYTDMTSYEANYFDYYFIYGGTYNEKQKKGRNSKQGIEKERKTSKTRNLNARMRDINDDRSVDASGSPFGIEGVISGYRLLTGAAPLYRISVYGFWQCREHYRNQSEILNAASEFRRRKLPVDNIVQDWQYWGSLGWGPHWDPSIYPNPREMADELHGMNINLMVSVWSKFDTSTVFYTTMKENNWLINGSIYYNPYDKDAQFEFYTFINDSMFSNGIDYIWLDATEPENFPNKNDSLLLSNPNDDNGNSPKQSKSGVYLMNPYSLFVTNAVKMGYYNSKSINTNKKRIFSLTRSSFAGQQATGGALWSGDTTSTWGVLYSQICASNNFALSGMPYWSQDIGGFFRPGDQYNSLTYRRLLIRWFQFGAFVPIYRVHGAGSHTEYWHYGPVVEKDVLLISNFRYRLIPYIYSMAYKISRYGFTLQRPLVMDFSNDVNIYGIRNASNSGIKTIATFDHEFMFGESLLIAPVYNDNNETNIYLPQDQENMFTKWYDFWSGKIYNQSTLMLNSNIDLDKIAVFVTSGSVLVLGPFVQYSNEIPWIELEIRVYRGSDGKFVFYEDDGEYVASIEENLFSLIVFEWIDANNTLVIGDRDGSFDGMIDESRIFNIVLVDENHGIGVNVTDAAKVDKVVTYDGTKQTISF